jgi:hypothetical protein
VKLQSRTADAVTVPQMIDSVGGEARAAANNAANLVAREIQRDKRVKRSFRKGRAGGSERREEG